MLCFESTKMPALTLNNIFNFKKNPSVTTGNHGSKRVCAWAAGAAPAAAARGALHRGCPQSKALVLPTKYTDTCICQKKII